MTTSSNQFDLSLAHQAMFSVSDASGVQIACCEGSVWLTLDNDTRDIVLNAGDSFITTEHRRALIYALVHSALRLDVAPSAAPARRPGFTPEAPVSRVTLTLQPA